MAVGYPERGRRAGVRTSAEQTRKQFNIPVISSPRFQYANPHLTRGVNFNNLLAFLLLAGGACIYIQDHIKFETPENLQCCNDHEIIWLKLNPPIVRKSTEGATK